MIGYRRFCGTQGGSGRDAAAQRLYRWLGRIGLVFLAVGVTACSKPTDIDRVRQENALHLITVNSPSVYYIDREGAAGFEYELAQQFANELGVELRVRVADSLSEIQSVMSRGYASVAAAGLGTIQPVDSRPTDRNVSAEAFLSTRQQLIYASDQAPPKQIEDLYGKRLRVMSSTHHAARLSALKASGFDALQWEEVDDLGVSDLLRQVEEGEIDYTIVDETDFAIHNVYHPKVRVAFDFEGPIAIGWAFAAGNDGTLKEAANQFFQRIEADGTLMQLKERYFGHLQQLNYVGARTFNYHVERRLPRYETMFRKAAEKYGVDWRLLAAIGYQESHWRPNATSPTGVRGLMMLTQVTASEMNIANRLDPQDSIEGGAKYFAQIMKLIPDRIQDPDRTWFALASYNVGYGHVEDARVLTAKAGKDPDRWIDVKEFLPKLSQKKWYQQTRHGYARGHEPVLYVQNIRRYYDVLAWKTADIPTAPQVASPDEPAEGQEFAEVDLPPSLDILPSAL